MIVTKPIEIGIIAIHGQSRRSTCGAGAQIIGDGGELEGDDENHAFEEIMTSEREMRKGCFMADMIRSEAR